MNAFTNYPFILSAFLGLLLVSVAASRASSHRHENTSISTHPNHGKRTSVHHAFVPFKQHRKLASTSLTSRSHRSHIAPITVLTKPVDRRKIPSLQSLSSDAIANAQSNSNNAAETAQQLLEKARNLRIEATTAEQNLRRIVQQKKDT